jgi:hypothetical protein
VRNNQQPDWSATPWLLPGWPLAARSRRPARIPPPRHCSDELKTLPLVEHEVVLQCSGNGLRTFDAPCRP